MGENVATKADLDALEQRMNARLAAQEQRLTLRFIAILLPSLGLLFAALRLLPG